MEIIEFRKLVKKRFFKNADDSRLYRYPYYISREYFEKLFSVMKTLDESKFDEEFESTMERYLFSVYIGILRPFVREYMGVESPKSYSKETIVKSIVSYFIKGEISIRKRKTEGEILEEELEEDEYCDPYGFTLFTFEIEGKKYEIPKEVIHRILSFLPHDYSLITSIGSLNKDFYVSVLSTFSSVKIKKANVYDISLMALRTTKSIDFTDSLNFISIDECKHLCRNLRLNISLNSLDFSGIESYLIIKKKFTFICYSNKPKISFPNCTVLKFPQKSKSKHLRTMKSRHRLSEFATELKSTLPNLSSIYNTPPLWEILREYTDTARLLSFNMTEGYQNRGFDFESMERECKKIGKSLERLELTFQVRSTKKTTLHNIEVSDECLYLSKFLPLLQSLTSLSVCFDFRNSSLPIDLSGVLFPPKQTFPDSLTSLELSLPQLGPLRFCHGGYFKTFLSFELLAQLKVLKVSMGQKRSLKPILETIKLLNKDGGDDRDIVVDLFNWHDTDFKDLMIIFQRYRNVSILSYDRHNESMETPPFTNLMYNQSIVGHDCLEITKKGREMKIRLFRLVNGVFKVESFREFLAMDGFFEKSVDVITYMFMDIENEEKGYRPWNLFPQSILDTFKRVEKRSFSCSPNSRIKEFSVWNCRK